MPVLLQTTDLREGMRLAKTLVAGSETILPKDKALNRKDIISLRSRFPTLQVAVEDERLDEEVSFQDDTHEANVSTYVRKHFTNTVHDAHRALETTNTLRGTDLRVLESAVAEIIRFLHENPVKWALLADNSDLRATAHAGNSFYLAMVLGEAVRSYFVSASLSPRNKQRSNSIRTPDLSKLGIAALFMDVSLWGHDLGVSDDRPLTDAERYFLTNHPLASAKILPSEAGPLAFEAIINHHENFNGTGYPRQLSESSVPLFARILRIADAYSTATSWRQQNKARCPVIAHWEMTCGRYEEFFDPILLKIFQSVVQPYPIGAKLRLNCGRHGVVVRHGQIHGLLPEIIIAFDEDNEPLPAKKLQGPYRLDSHPEIRVISYAGTDLSLVYGDQPVFTEEEIHRPCDFDTMFDSHYP